MINNRPAFVARLQRITCTLHIAFAGLLGLYIARHGTLSGLLLGLLAIAPLLPSLPGLLRGRVYTASWTSMLLAFYACLLLAEAYMQPSQRLVLIGFALLAAADFVALMLYTKAAKTLAR